MPRRRFFIPGDRIRDGIAVLTHDQAHHLRDVLRLGVGDEVELFDGAGSRYLGKIECCGVDVRIGRVERIKLPEERYRSLVLAAALIKPDRFEWILQKGTELGVTGFLPLNTQFTTVRIPPARLEARLERWRRIVREASKQCGRATVPEVGPPCQFTSLLNAADYRGHARFLLYEKAQERFDPASAICEPVLLCVGPEGGWEEAEAKAAGQVGFRVISMGSATLRAETAAIAAVSIFQFLLRR